MKRRLKLLMQDVELLMYIRLKLLMQILPRVDVKTGKPQHSMRSMATIQELLNAEVSRTKSLLQAADTVTSTVPNKTVDKTSNCC
jgi:hypothetical protein